MRSSLDTLRTGDWLSRQRLRLWASALLAISAAALVAVAAFSNGLTDYQGRPLGTDFSCFWTAGLFVLEGRPQLAFDHAALHSLQLATFGPETPFYGWLYPPFFLLVAGVLALIPYPVALALWLTLTLALYLLVIRAIIARPQGVAAAAEPVDPLWLLLALAWPAVFVNIGHGQNGFLSAALFGGALVVLDRRPVLAGILFGLLVYKPQFGLLLPLVLAASGRWRTAGAAAVTVALLTAATVAVLGTGVWWAWLASADTTRVAVLEAGSAGWHKLHGVFAAVRLWGGPVGLAYALHGAVALVVAATVVWMWRARVRFALQAAALLVGSLAVAPHSHDYDLVLLGPALAFMLCDAVRYGFAAWEKSLLAAVAVVPLVTRPVAEHLVFPLGTIAVLLLLLLIVRRARLGLESPAAAVALAVR